MDRELRELHRGAERERRRLTPDAGDDWTERKGTPPEHRFCVSCFEERDGRITRTKPGKTWACLWCAWSAPLDIVPEDREGYEMECDRQRQEDDLRRRR